ncbi:MAG: Na/Pi symporter, partial [Proteobacteria bacterium]|nr:Na/Pi symporter [Pseudomonadota bacterium]
STSVSAFIVAGLSASGLIQVRNALPLIFWANAGCSILVVIAVLDIKYLVFLLLFFSGISFAFEKPYHLRFLARALFGMGMLFYGLQLIQLGAAPLATMPWVREVLAASHGSAMLTFLLGAVMTIVTQTSLGVILIGITMTKAGVFSVEQSVMLVYGAELGSSVVTWILSSGVRGTSKQLVMSQAVFNIMAVSLMVTLFYVEQLFGIPLVVALVHNIHPDLEIALAYLVVIYNTGIPAIASFIYTPILCVLTHLWPETQEEALGKIKFIKKHALDTPEAALLMVERELLRLVNRFPAYVQSMSGDKGTARSTKPIAPYHAAFANINQEIAYTLSDISEQNMGEHTSAHLLRLLNIQELLTALEQNLVSFCEAVEKAFPGNVIDRFITVLMESQEFLLLQSSDALAGGDDMDIAILKTITADNGDMVEKVRKQYLEAEEGLGLTEKMDMHRISALFERTTWLLNRLSVVVTPPLGSPEAA